MTKYVKNHTKYILEQIKAKNISQELLRFHQIQINHIQHERLIHLLVMCLFTILFIGSVVLFIAMPTLATILLSVIFAIVEIFYVLHYYLLENSVQSWYKLENDMISFLQNIGTNTSD